MGGHFVELVKAWKAIGNHFEKKRDFTDMVDPREKKPIIKLTIQ